MEFNNKIAHYGTVTSYTRAEGDGEGSMGIIIIIMRDGTFIRGGHYY